MKRTAGAWLLLAALSGCVSMEYGNDAPGSGCCGVGTPPAVPGVQGPWGQPVPMAAPYSAMPPTSDAARAMMSVSMPLEMVQPQRGVVQASAAAVNGQPNGQVPPGAIAPPGVPFGPGMPSGSNQIGVPFVPNSIRAGPPGAVAAVGALTGGHSGQPFPTQRTSIRFGAPVGMKVSWYAPGPDGKPTFSNTPLEVPGRYNFAQASIYRLKLSAIPKHPEQELYPTLEVVPANSRTSTFLAHTAVPLTFTEEDFEQVAAGNYLVKVIYLPDPQYQDVATAGPDEVVSSRLEPGANPIDEALRRGSILLVVRMGNIDLELRNSPPMDAPSPYMQHTQMPQFGGPPAVGMGPGGPRPGPMVPHGMMGKGLPTGPNGQLLMPYPPGASGVRGPGAGAQPGAVLPPPQFGPTLPPTTAPRVIQGTPVGQIPDGMGVKVASGTPTAAQLAAQDLGSDQPPPEKKKSRWHWPWSKSNDTKMDSQ